MTSEAAAGAAGRHAEAGGEAVLPAPVTRPGEVLEVFLRDPPAHAYGIADVAQLWDRSRWWRVGDALVGVLDLPGAAMPVLYAVSAGAQNATLDLLAALAPALPAGFVATGPRGMATRLSGSYRALWARDYVKLHLAEPRLLPPPDPRVRTLVRGDLDALERLFATDPVAGDFFHPSLLDTGCYVGVDAGAQLLACAGVHVIDEPHGVAAIGNVATHPAHRRRGLGRAVTATLCHRLRARVATVALNVREANLAARALYEALGFRMVLPYEEAELVRR